MRPGGEGGHAGAVRVTEFVSRHGSVLRLARASVRFRAVSGDTSCADPACDFPLTIAPALSHPLRSSLFLTMSGHLNTLICVLRA